MTKKQEMILSPIIGDEVMNDSEDYFLTRDIETRQERVFELLVLGFSTAEIQQTIRKQFNVSRATVTKDISSAKKELENSADEFKKVAFGVQFTRLEALFGNAMDSGELGTALQVLKEENRLLGIYNAQKEKENETEKPVSWIEQLDLEEEEDE